MKKRLLGLLLTGIMIFSVTACSFDLSKDKVEKEEDTDTEEEDKKDKEKDKDDGGEGDDKEAVLTSDYLYEYLGNCYTIDASGAPGASYDIEELKSVIPKGQENGGVNFKKYGDGILFFDYTDYSSGDSVTTFYALDPDTKEYSELFVTDPGWYLDCIDFYEGKLYVDIQKDGAREEKVFVKDGDGAEFISETSRYADLLKGTEGYLNMAGGSYITDGCYGYYDSSYTRSLEKAGYLIGRADDGYYMITADGNSEKFEELDDGAVIESYDSGHIIYGEYGEDYHSYIVYVYDLKTGKSTPVSEDERIYTLSFIDGKLFYYMPNDTGEYGVLNNSVYCYDCGTGESKELYSEGSVPGINLTPGVQGFRICGGRAYYMKPEGNCVNWVSVDIENGTDLKDTGFAVNEITAFDHGSVEYKSGEIVCPYCGTVLESYYIEKFVLDDGYENAAKINEKLDEAFNNNVSYYDMDTTELEQDACEYHLEYPDEYHETIDEKVSKVGIIGKDYLYIDYDGYWYGGGAHGYPSKSQDLFDMRTGESVTFADLYPGTDEDFKELAAEKTRDDYNSYDEYASPYFAQDPDEVYRQAYDSSNVNSGNFEFAEDGVYMYYYPYDMGSYAAGFIEIFFTYDELGFELK